VRVWAGFISSGNELVANSCEHDIEPSNFVKDREFVGQQRKYYFHKKESNVWNIIWSVGQAVRYSREFLD
jgi:hypothetical protein